MDNFMMPKFNLPDINIPTVEIDTPIQHMWADEQFEIIKKYKLASSEGINKFQNRIIRFEQLYKLCITDNTNVIDALERIVKALNDKKEERLTVRETSTESDA